MRISNINFSTISSVMGSAFEQAASLDFRIAQIGLGLSLISAGTFAIAKTIQKRDVHSLKGQNERPSSSSFGKRSLSVAAIAIGCGLVTLGALGFFENQNQTNNSLKKEETITNKPLQASTLPSNEGIQARTLTETQTKECQELSKVTNKILTNISSASKGYVALDVPNDYKEHFRGGYGDRFILCSIRDLIQEKKVLSFAFAPRTTEYFLKLKEDHVEIGKDILISKWRPSVYDFDRGLNCNTFNVCKDN